MKRNNGPGSVESQLDTVAQESALDIAEERDPERFVLAGEQAALVRSILAQLPERQQVCLMLRSTGFSYEEIAEATGIPITSIGSVLARAMQAFRRSYHE